MTFDSYLRGTFTLTSQDMCQNGQNLVIGWWRQKAGGVYFITLIFEPIQFGTTLSYKY